MIYTFLIGAKHDISFEIQLDHFFFIGGGASPCISGKDRVTHRNQINSKLVLTKLWLISMTNLIFGSLHKFSLGENVTPPPKLTPHAGLQTHPQFQTVHIGKEFWKGFVYTWIPNTWDNRPIQKVLGYCMYVLPDSFRQGEETEGRYL